jgi:hypothetical protein
MEQLRSRGTSVQFPVKLTECTGLPCGVEQRYTGSLTLCLRNVKTIETKYTIAFTLHFQFSEEWACELTELDLHDTK